MHTHATRQSMPNLHNSVYITYLRAALFTELVMVFEWLELDFYQLVPNHNNFVLLHMGTKITNW